MKKPYDLVEQRVVDKAFADVCGRLTAPWTLIPLLLVALPLTACEQTCTTEIRPSVNVQITDEAGAAMDASVEYDIGDGPVSCDQIGDIAGYYSCGEDFAGEIEILVSAQGYQDRSETLSPESDECHVITEELDIELVLEEEA